MIAWTVAKTQWLRIYRNKLARVAIISALFIPLLYCGLYLYAFWDPYGLLNKLPVALVMEDKGGTYHGQKVNYGKGLAEQLQNKINLKWQTVSADVAKNGILGNRYYLVVTIPKDFTEKSLSITSKHPQTSHLIFTRNEGKNYIAGQIANRIEGEIAGEVSNQFTKQYVQNILELTLQSKVGLSRAAEGAHKLSDGAKQLSSGIDKLALAIRKASVGATQVDEGTKKLATGSDQVSTGASKIAVGSREVADETKKLGNLMANLQAGQSNQLQRLQTESAKVKDELNNIVSYINKDANFNPNTGNLEASITGVQNQLNSLSNLRGQSDSLNSNVKTIQAKLGQIDKLADGTDQVAKGANQVSDGAHALKNGTAQLSAALHEISTKLPALTKGAKALEKGNEELANKLAQTTKEQQADPSKLADIISHPISIEDESLYKVGLYGIGLAPYFLPLSLWLGGLMLYFAIPVGEKRWRLYPSHPARIQLGKILTFVPLGLIQSLITGLVIHYGLGLPIQQLQYFYLFLFLLSLMSIAIVGALMRIFGSGPGRLISVILLVLQLASSGGTFPIDLTPRVFQVLHPFLPMTYGVEGLRQIIVFHQPSLLVTPFSMITLFLAIAVGITFMVERRTFRLADLQERDQLETS